MARRLKRGCLIVIEGIDGAGKTTQCSRLAERLRAEGWDVERLREPTNGPFGQKIRETVYKNRDKVSLEEELQLFVEDRRQNVRENIEPALERGDIVLLDRYYYSTIAYQGARGGDIAHIRAENEKFAPPADLLLYLRIPVDLVTHRIEVTRCDTRNDLEKESYLEKVREIFDALPDPQLVRIDGTAEADTVFAKIWEAVEEFLRKRVDRES